jgi:hypothetical protein
MIKYFRTLLKTLISIEKSLNEIASCVKTNDRRFGNRKYLVTRHWNDSL